MKMQAIKELRMLGFNVWLENDQVHYQKKDCIKLDSIDIALFQGLIAYIKENKKEAIEFLQRERQDAMKN